MYNFYISIFIRRAILNAFFRKVFMKNQILLMLLLPLLAPCTILFCSEKQTQSDSKIISDTTPERPSHPTILEEPQEEQPRSNPTETESNNGHFWSYSSKVIDLATKFLRKVVNTVNIKEPILSELHSKIFRENLQEIARKRNALSHYKCKLLLRNSLLCGIGTAILAYVSKIKQVNPFIACGASALGLGCSLLNVWCAGKQSSQEVKNQEKLTYSYYYNNDTTPETFLYNLGKARGGGWFSGLIYYGFAGNSAMSNVTQGLIDSVHYDEVRAKTQKQLLIW